MTTMTLDELLEESRSPDAETRRRAAHDLCPCELKADHPEAWSRILELIRDEDVRVRKAAMHTLTDGSPREREADIVQALESMYNDPDRKLRRQVRQRLATYRASGRLNHH